MKTVSIGPFIGMNNKLPDFKLHVDKVGDFVRSAIDVDLNNAGEFESRKAFAKIQSMTGAHSLFMDSATTGYLIRASALYAISLPTYSETLLSVLSNNSRAAWVVENGIAYYSNGSDSGKIIAGVHYPIGMETPDSPIVSAVAGSLYAGKYQVALAYRNSVSGEESGVSASENFELSATGGLRVTLPGASAGATHVAVYVSGCNGSIPTFAGQYTTATAYADITTPNDGRDAVQRYESPLPAGDVMFFSNGRLCSALGPTLYVGLPHRAGYYIPVKGVIQFGGDVTNGICAQFGTYVTADKTYWFPGDLGNVEAYASKVLPYGAVKGTVFSFPNNSKIGWFGDKGVVFGSPSGEVEAVMSDNISLTPPASGASIVVDAGDYRKVVSCGWCVNLDTKAATQYSGYEFTSMSGGYATKNDGIYSLDAAGDVEGEIDLGRVDFGTEQQKHMPAIYVGCTSSEPVSMKIKTPDATEQTYVARSFSTDLRINRVDVGKGLRANWFGLKLIAANFKLASVSFAPVASTRRI